MANKLTDAEVKKALEWLKNKAKKYCEQCAYKNSEVCDICVFDKVKLALDLINRYEAEVERLEEDKMLLRECNDQLAEGYETAKAEAYKECIEKAKERLSTCVTDTQQMMFELRLDNLLNELVGEEK